MSLQEAKFLEQQEEQMQDLLRQVETSWEKRLRESAEAEEEYWAAIERKEILEGEEDW